MTERTDWTESELARLLQEGLDHLNRLQSGAATQRDAARFIAWRTQSPAHEEAFRAARRLQNLVKVADEAPARVQDAPKATVISLAEAAERRMPRRMFLGGALAASVTGGLWVAGRSLNLVPSVAELGADYRTDAGGRQLVRLGDGASVDLNTRTSIRLRDEGALPLIELISGEVIVNGATGAALVAGDGTSRVEAGRFAARRDGDEVCITCLAGSVTVSWGSETRRLGPSAQVRYSDGSIGRVEAAADPTILTAWQSGTLVFRDMPMRQVVAEINRYRPGKVYLANTALGDRQLSGTYFINRLNDFFRQAELGLGVKVTRLPGDIVVLS